MDYSPITPVGRQDFSRTAVAPGKGPLSSQEASFVLPRSCSSLTFCDIVTRRSGDRIRCGTRESRERPWRRGNGLTLPTRGWEIRGVSRRARR
ncbi:hypothetical protein SKAU_G00395070 [Synaphobranchus kaupii]|uniref:Uncharacterized protein n=1 Tax=Synaphobranchus kaupii TaxID=118154 RepID=A0A9Q1IE02_SYNKA|nr:hypothetical protein SKAU_G00395070 [Synaphobranchus kaupii]